MSKESRRRQRAASRGAGTPTTSGASGASHAGTSTSARPSSGTAPTARAGRRERSRPAAAGPSLLERRRTILLVMAVVAAVVVAGVFVFAAASQPAYACSTEWTPDPTASPAVGASPQPGYAQPDMGQGHVANGTSITYTYCPPASGRHYNGTQTGPIASRVYGPSDAVTPEGWIHNLEHGALIVLYRGDSEGATATGQQALKDFFSSYPNSPVCGFKPGTSIGPVFARFDDMQWPFAALVWGRVLPLQSLDTAAILQFDKTYGERTNPETFCDRASPSPSAGAPSGGASPSAAPSATPS